MPRPARGRPRPPCTAPVLRELRAGALARAAAPARAVRGQLFEPPGARAIAEARLHAPQLETSCGGTAVRRPARRRQRGRERPDGTVRRGAQRPHRLPGRDALSRGAPEPALFALLGRVLKSLGSKTNYSTVARDMDVPTGPGRRGAALHRPATGRSRNHVESLAAAYQLLVVYAWRATPTRPTSPDKKLYFADPLLHTVAHDKAPGLQRDEPALIENAVALALYRRYEPEDQRLHGFHLPVRCTCGRRPAGRFDFVCGPRSHLDVVEVKYQGTVSPAYARGLTRTLPDRPVVVVTRHDLHVDADTALIPPTSSSGWWADLPAHPAGEGDGLSPSAARTCRRSPPPRPRSGGSRPC